MIKKADINQRKIIESLRKCGCSVRSLHMVGKGLPDLLVGDKGRNFLFEIKNPEKFPSERKLTEDEQKFFDSWRGQVCIVETLEDALKIINQ